MQHQSDLGTKKRNASEAIIDATIATLKAIGEIVSIDGKERHTDYAKGYVEGVSDTLERCELIYGNCKDCIYGKPSYNDIECTRFQLIIPRDWFCGDYKYKGKIKNAKTGQENS